MDSAFEKACIPIQIPDSQTSCLKADFAKFGRQILKQSGKQHFLL